MATTRILLGIDVSLTSCAVVACATGWSGDWALLKKTTAGRHLRRAAGDLAHVRRLEDIAAHVVEFAREHAAEAAWIESYAYGMRSCAHSLGEAGGVLRLELHRAGITLHTAPISSARKLLLGKLPRTKVKESVVAQLAAAGCPFETGDECDAFAALNWGLHVEGATHLVGVPDCNGIPHPPRFCYGFSAPARKPSFPAAKFWPPSDQVSSEDLP